MKVLHSVIIGQKLDAQASKREANSARGRRNKKAGEATQTVFEWRLRALGIRMVETIHTPWKIIRHPVTRKIVNAIQLEKVSGDFRGVLAGGRSVLVEVKRRDHLVFSDFEKHQINALDQHHQAGGLSMIGWQWPGGDSLMVWPVEGFCAGTSLSVARALALNVTRIHL